MIYSRCMIDGPKGLVTDFSTPAPTYVHR